MSTGAQIPVILLKTKSQPHDGYEEHFLPPPNLTVPESRTGIRFTPEFIPVLEHRQNTDNLGQLAELLQAGRLKEKYGGMIFTSQRAVEAWADTVAQVESGGLEGEKESGMVCLSFFYCMEFDFSCPRCSTFGIMADILSVS